ncbi:MAG: hypothetical protein KF745_14705 [Phycisphaeraceae bacterium]|nr:hypothetical protein [Phycisphaeraceae bacterium]
MNRTPLLSVSAILLAAGLAATPASAQNALGNGQRLDNNLQRGSGGVNTRVRDFQAELRYQNAVVNRTVAGGKEFRGDSVLPADQEFAQSLPVNNIYPYLRDSSTSALSAQGIRTTDAISYQRSLATGQGVSTSLAGGYSVAREGVVPQGEYAAASARSTAQYLAAQSIAPTMLTTRQADDGSSTGYAASPLLGVKVYSLASDLNQGAREAGALATPDQRIRVQRDPMARGGLEVSLRGNMLPNAQSYTQDNTQIATETGTNTNDYLSTQINTMVITNYTMPTNQPEVGDKEIPETPAAAPPDVTQPGDSSGDKSADAINAWRQELTELKSKLRDAPIADTSAPRQRERLITSGMRVNERTGEIIDPTADAAAAKARKDAEDRLIGIGAHAINADTVEKIKSAKLTIKTFDPSGIQSNLAYSEFMVGGQRALGEGRYFDAEDQFARALGTIPGDTLAQIGRLHSQIGAGLYLSAAANLRNLLLNNPELVGVRYEAKLLPAKARWDEIERQLRNQLNSSDEESRKAAAALLAYMGYQFRDTAAVREGLATIERTIKDKDSAQAAYLNLIREVWTAPPSNDE